MWEIHKSRFEIDSDERPVMMVHDTPSLVLRLCLADPGNPRRNIEGESPLQGRTYGLRCCRREMLGSTEPKVSSPGHCRASVMSDWNSSPSLPAGRYNN